MAERPISITAACVRAIFAGRKTQLRYVPNPDADANAERGPGCPLGTIDDLLWIREPWQSIPEISESDSGFSPIPGIQLLYQADQHPITSDGLWLPTKSKPRWASRISVQIVDVRKERLQQIPDEDLLAEGGMWQETRPHGSREIEREGFARWWDAVHAASESKWDRNPVIWVVRFQLIA